MAKGYGWELEYIKNLSEIELYQAIINLQKILKRERLEKLGIQVLGTAAGMGDKASGQKIRSEFTEARSEDSQEEQREIISKGKPRKSEIPLLDRETLTKVVNEAKQNART